MEVKMSQQKHSNIYYVRTTDGAYAPRKDAVGVRNDIDADIFRIKNLYYEGRTGIFISDADRLGNLLTDKDKTEHFKANINAAIAQYGLTPRYTKPELKKAELFPPDDTKILARTLFGKGKSRFTRFYDEDGIQLYTMDSDKSSYSRDVYTPCRGWMIGVGHFGNLSEVAEKLKEPGFDLYASIAEKFDKSVSDPLRWADPGVADFLGRLDAANAHNKPIIEERERERNENAAKREAEEREQTERVRIEYEIAIKDAEQAVLNRQSVANRDIGGKNLLLQLFRENGVELPLKTQGWVKSSLTEVQFSGKGHCGCSYSGYGSSVIFGYINTLIDRIDDKYRDVAADEYENEQDIDNDEDEEDDMEWG
jgi:hypothetical protein